MKKRLEWFGTSVSEQETIIQISRDGKKANIYSTDTLMINKLDKIAKRKKEVLCDGKLAAVEYEVDKKMVKVSAARKNKELSEEERARRAERMKKVREIKNRTPILPVQSNKNYRVVLYKGFFMNKLQERLAYVVQSNKNYRGNLRCFYVVQFNIS